MEMAETGAGVSGLQVRHAADGGGRAGPRDRDLHPYAGAVASPLLYVCVVLV